MTNASSPARASTCSVRAGLLSKLTVPRDIRVDACMSVPARRDAQQEGKHVKSDAHPARP